MKYIIGNWKMNGSAAAGIELAQAVARHVRPGAGVKVVLCPPFTLLAQAAWAMKGREVDLGGQDCHFAASGAFTGDVSASQLKDAGCGYVIVGHSERRQHHKESSALVAQKAQAALDAGLVPIVCVGESLEERESGRYLEVIGRQVEESVPRASCLVPDNTKHEARGTRHYIIAYEPVWAIGSGKTPTLPQIAETHKHIAKCVGNAINPAILYGGSVNAANAREILHADGVDGVLVGGASLKAVEFCAIIDGAIR